MKNPKIILYALCISIISLLNACQKDYGVIESEATPTIEVYSNSGGLVERSSAQQLPSAHFTTLRYTPNGTRNLTSSTGSVNLTWTANSTNDAITFSSRTQLATVLATNSSTQQAHHIIPWQWIAPAPQSLLHETIRAAAYAGFHPNNTYNGINVSNTLHTGSHPAYSSYVKFQLDAYQTKNITSNTFNNIIECQTANTWVQCKLIPHLRNHINTAVSQNTPMNTYFTSTFPLRSYIGD